jgi:dTDP-glucose 4,6-dehydratase
MRVLVTGGAGFIGSNFVRYFIAEHPDDSVVVLDKLTYAGRIESIQDVMTYERMEFVEGDIADPGIVREAMEGCDAVMNFAAESHVDRSIEEPGGFIQTDVYGTYVLLQEARAAGVERYLQVSTDEVYGSIEEGSFTEQSPLEPSSPYSASKAGGDLLVGAYGHTFGIDAVICRASNNYGTYQYPEKLIPLCILNALHGDPLPVYGDGMQVRNWLHVSDHCRALDLALREGKAGETYNVGGPDELPNIEVVRLILELTGQDESLVEHVTDRLGHDRRYSLDSAKLYADLGWAAKIRFADGLRSVVDWYRDNEWWWEPIRSGSYRDYYERQYGQRLKG